jgi:hypothetical protein
MQTELWARVWRHDLVAAKSSNVERTNTAARRDDDIKLVTEKGVSLFNCNQCRQLTNQ